MSQYAFSAWRSWLLNHSVNIEPNVQPFFMYAIQQDKQIWKIFLVL